MMVAIALTFNLPNPFLKRDKTARREKNSLPPKLLMR